MPTVSDALPLTDTVTPADQAELAQTVREAYADGLPLYPIGGGTSLDFGLPAKDPGIGLSMRALRRLVDYPARDMTITVEAGISLDSLSATLAKENQRLPIDLPNAHQATLGGVIATNTSGARRYANGTVRDYVIGITAVDGRGTVFHGGGRVVKNVAGYDFCKLLSGSMGAIGIITQVTLRVKPIPECSRFVTCRPRGWAEAEKLLAALVTSRVAPSAIELLSGPGWNDDAALGTLNSAEAAHILVGFEGTEPEVAWMTGQLCDEWRQAGVLGQVIPDNQTSGLWMRLAQFPVEGKAPLTIKAAIRPSRVVSMIEHLRGIDPQCSVQAHAGNGVVVARLTDFGSAGLSKVLVGRIQPTAVEQQGHVIVLSCETPSELTRQCWWGSVGDAAATMESVKRQFDPKNLLNRGRFIYGGS